MAGPALLSRTAYQGDIWAMTVTFTDGTDPLDVSGGTWRAQVRKTPSSTTVLADIAVDTTDAAAGVLVLSLTAEDTAGLPPECWWDLEDTTAGKTYLRCKLTVTREVTRDE